MKLLSVEEARARMIAATPQAPHDTVEIMQAVGRVLAADVSATRDQPPFRASAMDGWALRAADTPGTLRIVGESAAGHGHAGEVGAGEAVRIFTGAAVPAGCDTVVIQEDAAVADGLVTVPAARLGACIRPAAGDFAAGQTLLASGARLDPWRVALAAAAGYERVQVHARPAVSLIATGEEIVRAPARPGPFQIYDSGSPALSAMARAWGADVEILAPAGDDLETLVAAIVAAKGDLVVTIGGASVGDHDLVRAAGEALGLDLKVASVAVRPGKPTFFGLLGDGRRLLGLPGNPASAFVCAELFLRPILAKAQGLDWREPKVTARLEVDLPANGPREHWMRATLSWREAGVFVTPYRDQDSSLVSVFAEATALLKRPADAAAASVGDMVDVWPLERA